MVTRRDFLVAGVSAVVGKAIAYPIRGAVAARSGQDTADMLPYDSEVEYIESTGTQYINTGVILSSNFRVVCDWLPLRVSSGSSAYAFGAYGGGTNFGVNVDTAYAWGEYCVWKSSSVHTGTVSRGVRHIIDLSADGLIRDGYNVYTPTGTFIGTKSAYLFWANGTGQGKAISRMYSVKFYVDNTILIGDYIPIRFTNEFGEAEGAMYDSISGNILRNQGTGSFIIGPDI